ncbi:MAG TPA: BrnT family toxin [Chloroflexota bacterium]|nr:BrnT family toxin [Chloroflexota bacterium]HUM70830.1 BrnT family toxin [Chloroflexota bacterium]
MRYQFDWDPAKEAINIRKHQVNFRRAATVFRDPNQLSLFDDEHSQEEDRWVTMGIDSGGVLRVVIHTFAQVNENLCEIRIISARKATSAEATQYNEGMIP